MCLAKLAKLAKLANFRIAFSLQVVVIVTDILSLFTLVIMLQLYRLNINNSRAMPPYPSRGISGFL